MIEITAEIRAFIDKAAAGVELAEDEYTEKEKHEIERVKESKDLSEKQSNKERIKEITAGIEKGIMELFESDRYRNYLTTMSRFHKYSLNNVMLIHAQRPNATLVAGFSKWKNSFGRHVKKGEKGIQILAPTPYKIKVDKEKLDPDTKLPMLDDEGKPITLIWIPCL